MGKDSEFLEAARVGNIKYVEKYLHSKTKKIAGPLASLRRRPGLNVQDTSGYTALHHAALNGHIEIIQLLLANGAQINISDIRGSSPLHLAAWAGHHDILKIFLNSSDTNKEINCNLQTIEMDTPLHCAAQHGHTGALTTLLASGANPNLRNIRGETPLDLAAQYGRLQVVQILVRTHPDLLQPFNIEQSQNFLHEEQPCNSQIHSAKSFQLDTDLRSNTEEEYNLSSPLCLASRNGHKDIVEFLLCAGMNVNYLTRSGTALHEAAVCGKENVVRILLKYGINRNSRNFRGQTAIDVLKEFPEHVTKPILSILESDPQCSYSEHENNIGNIAQTSNIRLYQSYGNSANCCSDEPEYYLKCNHNAHLMTTSSSSASDMCSQSISPICMNKDYNSDYYMQIGSAKILSTPPKKPPRRNLSITLMEQHHQEQNFIRMHSTFNSKSDSGYEYIYKTGINEIKLKNSIKLMTKQSTDTNQPIHINYSNRTNKTSQNELKSKPKKSCDYEKSVLKSYNPNRKLKRNREYYETFSIDFNKDKSNKIMDIENLEQCRKYPQSPTNYEQPPTPEHPPPSPSYAENLISEFIMPLSQRSIYSSSGSIASSVSISDERSIISSTDYCVEEYIGDVPFAGLFKGSTVNLTSINSSSYDSELINGTKLQYVLNQECNYIEADLPLVFNTFQKENNDMPSNIHNKNYKTLSFNNVIEENPKCLKKLETGKQSNLCSSTEKLNLYFPSENLFQTEHKDSEQKNYHYDFDILNEEEQRLEKSHSKSNSLNREEVENLDENFDASNFSHNFSVSEAENLENGKFNKFLNKKRLKIAELQFLLKELNIENVAEVLIENGWDNIKFMNGIIEEADFTIMKIPLNQHENIFKFIKSLPVSKNLLNFSEIFRNTTNLDSSSTTGNNNNEAINVYQWLESLDLTEYTEVFRNHLYNNMESIFGIWEIELQTVLDIKKIGHRKRILYSVSINRNHHRIHSQSNKFDSIQHSVLIGNQINSDLNILKANIIELNNDINDKLIANFSLRIQNPAVVSSKLPGGKYIRHNKKKNRPAPKPPIQQKQNKENIKNDMCHVKVNSFIKNNTNTNNNYPSNSNAGILPKIRAPSELLLGLPSNLETKWRHSASKLITESVRYNVYYLGSTIVKELRGTESTRKSIQKLKLNYKLLLTEEIYEESEKVEAFAYQKILNSKIHLVTLAISHRGVEFINVNSQKSICEHEIRNINCACQDSDDLRHFAYITKDSEMNTHYCHVFNVDKMDLATEIILTLGQAFEVAYQLALQDTRSIKFLSQQSNIYNVTK